MNEINLPFIQLPLPMKSVLLVFIFTVAFVGMYAQVRF